MRLGGQQKIIQIIIEIYLIANICLGFNINTYTREAVEMKEKTHALHYKSEFYDFISRTFYLQNGNSVQCKIPIYSTLNQDFLPILEEEFRNKQRNISLSTKEKISYEIQPNQSISQEEGDKILQSLQNQCTQYRTSKFLWEFCYKKYLRQYDDILTLAEGQKNKLEDIYAGYYPFYDNITNLTSADYKWEENRVNYYKIDNQFNSESIEYNDKIYKINPHIKQANLTDSTFVLITGKLVQFQRFNTTLFTLNNLPTIEFTTKNIIPTSQLSDSLILLQTQTINNTKININNNNNNTKSQEIKQNYNNSSNGEINNSTQIESNNTITKSNNIVENNEQQNNILTTTIYKYRYILHSFIDQHFGLAEREFPEGVQIDTFEVIVYMNKGKQRNNHFLSIYDNRYIYGKKLNALKTIGRNDLIIVQLYNQVFIKKVKKVWYHNLIELYKDNLGDHLINKDIYISSIQIFQRYQQYKLNENIEMQNQFISNDDSYYQFNTFNKKEKYLHGKYIIGFQYLNCTIGDTLIFISHQQYFILRVQNIYYNSIIELDSYLNNFKGFIIKANPNQYKPSYFDYYPQNKISENNSKNNNNKNILLDQNQQTSSNNNFKKRQINFKDKQFPRILSFKKIQNEATHDKNALQFTDLEDFSFKEEDLKKQRFMSFIIQTTSYIDDFAQLKLVLTDSLEEIKEGVEFIFTHDNQILVYDAFNKKNIVTKNKRYENSTLENTQIWILADQENTIRLGYSSVISPSTQVLQLKTNYTSLRYFRILTQHTINYFLLLTYLNVLDKPIDFNILKPDVQLYHNQSIKEQYYNGDFCNAIDANRSFSVQYICGESFFSILNVSEPSVCRYHLQIETYLLCQTQYNIYNIPPPPKNIYCILKESGFHQQK